MKAEPVYKGALSARLNGADYKLLGMDEHWQAPVAIIDAPNGFGEEVWNVEVTESLLAWRLEGGEVVSEMAGHRGRSTKNHDRKINLQPVGSLSRYRALDPVKFGHFYIPDELLNRVAESFGLPDFSGASLRPDLVMIEDAPLWHLLDIYKNRSSNLYATPSRIEMEARALLVAEHLVRTHHAAPKLAPRKGGLAPWQVKRACDAMEVSFRSELGLDALAAIAGCTAAHFSRAFKVSMGVSPFVWLRRRRMEHAKDLLRDPRLSLAEVALTVGFAAQPQFTTAFQRVTGATPGQWRRERRS